MPTKDQFAHLPKVLSFRERYLILALLIVAVASLVAAPISSYYHFSHEAPAYGGSFSEGVVGSPKQINPLLFQANDADRDISSLVYSGLMKYDESGNLVSDLASSYEISEDGLNYTFKIKDNARWQDGRDITADDVVFTITTAQNQDYGSSQRINWQGVDVNKIDDKTVIFKLKNKYAQFLGNTIMGILPKHIWENIKPASFSFSDLNIKPIGSGPYQFSKIRKDSAGNIKSYELTSFKNYFDGQAYIPKVVFNFYNSEGDAIKGLNNAEIDGLSSLSPGKLSSVKFSGKLNIKKLKLPRYFGIFFNQNQNKILSDKNIRLALSHGTDKQGIVDKVLEGEGVPASSPLLPDILNIPDTGTKYGFNANKAIGILDSSGWKLVEGSYVRKKAPATKTQKSSRTKEATAPLLDTKLEVKLTTSNWPELTEVAKQIKDQWQAIGVQVNVEVLSLPELQQVIKDRSYEALLFGEALTLNPDPFSFWHSSNKRDPGLNLAVYDNKDADKALEEARQILDSQARTSKYADFQKILSNDIPAIILYSQEYIYGQPAKIKNNNSLIISSPSDRFSNISRWFIDSKRSFSSKGT